MGIFRVCFRIALLSACATASVEARGAGDSRGELLYSTYCVSCHTTEVHWREKRLATDWVSLKAQVQRWQANAGLGLDESDVVAIGRYLNDLYYHFAADEPKQSRGIAAHQILARRQE